jgi:hypothetical protein
VCAWGHTTLCHTVKMRIRAPFQSNKQGRT